MSKHKKSKSSSFTEKVMRFDERFNLYNTLKKTMPVLVLGSCFLLGSIMMISYTANSTTSFTLPYTGESSSAYVSWKQPEHYTLINLPYELSVYSSSVTPKDQITFYAKKSNGSSFEIGKGSKGESIGEYSLNWLEADEARYEVWAEVEKSDGTTYKTNTIVVYAKK